LTEPKANKKKVCSDRLVDGEKLKHLAYAAFHCSSLRALAESTSDCETKREPTAPVEIEGIASSAMMEISLKVPFTSLSAPAVPARALRYASRSGHG
jgi:hypothetical protein